MPELVPPRLPSRLSRSKAPGAPFRPSGIVVTFAGSKHGHPTVPSSFGCVFLTTIGATYFAELISAVRAVALEPTLTELTPNRRVKIPCAGFLTVPLIVSFGPYELEKLTLSRPPPFLLAKLDASEDASAVLSGKACAPARAAESAVDWVSRSARYHEPTSRTRAAMPSSTVRKTRVRIVAWPVWLRAFIRLAPLFCSRGDPTSRPSREGRSSTGTWRSPTHPWLAARSRKP